MTKLKEKQFFCVGCYARCRNKSKCVFTAKQEDIRVTKFKNSKSETHALVTSCVKCDVCHDIFKIVKQSSVEKHIQKYGME